MEYLSARHIVEKWDIPRHRVHTFCTEGRIPGVMRVSTKVYRFGLSVLTTVVFLKICSTLDCNISDIMDVIDDDQIDTHLSLKQNSEGAVIDVQVCFIGQLG